MLIYVLVAIGVWAAVVLFLQRRVLFARGPIPTGAQAKPIAGVEVWRLKTPVGPVEAWLLSGRGVSAAHPGPTVIYAHGNGELIDIGSTRWADTPGRA